MQNRSLVALPLGCALAVGCGATGAASEPALPDSAAPMTDASSTDAPSPRAACTDEKILDPKHPLCGTPYTCCTSDVVLPADCPAPAIVEACRDGWCRVPVGCFVMGSPPCEPGRAPSEGEAVVRLTRSYEIQQYEMTRAQWEALAFPVQQTPAEYTCDGPDDECPNPTASWFEALEAANRMSDARGLPRCYELEGCGQGRTGRECTSVRRTTEHSSACRGYRLPTEAEWEHAARAGTRTAYYGGHASYSDGRVFYGCRADETLARIGWFNANTATVRPRGRKLPNGLGLFDMLGNLAEWTSAELRGVLDGSFVDPDSALPGDGLVATRGGSARTPKEVARAAARLGNTRTASAGVRLVRTLD